MPDDNRLHQLPASLGYYDLFNVEAYAGRLPANIRQAGGVFLPMWQREAMWINFELAGHPKILQWATKYAMRIFVGRVNAISGLMMDQESQEVDASAQIHDYIVIPGQQ